MSLNAEQINARDEQVRIVANQKAALDFFNEKSHLKMADILLKKLGGPRGLCLTIFLLWLLTENHYNHRGGGLANWIINNYLVSGTNQYMPTVDMNGEVWRRDINIHKFPG